MMTENKRIKDYSKILKINELYKAIQSEGSRNGYPTVIIRFSSCTHRCYFGDGGWCDSWYSSIHPEKGKYCFNDIVKIYDENPEIKEMMVTGGSPTMFPEVVNELTHFCHERGIIMTMETEGSHFIKTDYKIDLVSLSPKFSNSIPKLGVPTPQGQITDQAMVNKHNSLRLNKEAIAQMIDYHKDYHYKPVWDGTQETLNEIESFRVEMNIPKNKTWMMPAGDNRETLIKMYPIVITKCMEMNYNFSGRDHIIAFQTDREV